MREPFPLAKRNLGQHFLTCQKVISKIVQNDDGDFDAILEVGPGPGVLTRDLCHKKIPTYVIEKDSRFQQLLESILPKENIFICDALKFDIQHFLTTKNHQRVWLVSNLPYNISVPLTLKFMQCAFIKQMTLMYQKEVGQKFLDSQFKSKQNSLQVITQTYFQVKKLLLVPPGAFSPPPQVQSIVLSFIRLDSPHLPIENWKELEDFLRLIFASKRKQLLSYLSSFIDQKLLENLFKQLEIPLTARAESIKYEKILNLFKFLKASSPNLNK